MPLGPPAVRPLEAYLRRTDWQLAVLVVALVVVPGALELFDAPDTRWEATARSGAVGASLRTVAGRHVRPPRSC